MKQFTRLANVITETPTRPGSKEKPSERQQGVSKKSKAGGGNYYDAFNNMFYTKDTKVKEDVVKTTERISENSEDGGGKEDAVKTIKRTSENSDDGGGKEFGDVTASRTDGYRVEDTAAAERGLVIANGQGTKDNQHKQRGRTRAETSKNLGAVKAYNNEKVIGEKAKSKAAAEEITPARSILRSPSEEQVKKTYSNGLGKSTRISLAPGTFTGEGLNSAEKESSERNRDLPTTAIRLKSPASSTKGSRSDAPPSGSIKKDDKKKTLFSDAVKKTAKAKEGKTPVKLNQAVVTFNIRFAKGSDPKKEYNKLMALAVKTIRDNLDDKAGFIPLDGVISTDTKIIQSVQEMPALIMGPKKYFDIPNPGAFNSLSQGSRMIVVRRMDELGLGPTIERRRGG